MRETTIKVRRDHPVLARVRAAVWPGGVLIAIGLLLLAAPAARAASDTWDGSESGAWVTGSNWVGNQAPGNTTSGTTATTDTATFNNAVNAAITVDPGRTISGLTFAEGAGAFTFRGNPLYMSTSGAITISGTSASVSTSTVPSQTFYVDLTATTTLRNISLAKAAGAPLGSIFNLMSGTVRTSGVGGQNGSLQFNSNSISMVRGVIANSGLGGITNVSTESNGGQLAWLRAANTFTGDVTLRRSLLMFDSVTNVNGGASALGNATSGTIQMGFTSSGLNETTLYYTGLASTGHSTNRAIFLPQTNQGVLVAAGVGPLTWTGNVSGSTATANTFVLAGPSAAENIYGGAVVDSGSTVLSLLKRGHGTWNLSGANTYTGTTRITSGLLRIDFAGSGAVNANIVSASSPLVTGGGSLDVRGEAGENNSQTFNGTSFREGSMAISLTPGSGGSVSLALGALARGIAGSGSNSGSTVDFTLGSSGSVSTTTSTLTNGVLVVGGVAMASVGKSDWATVSSGTIAAVSSYETATNPASWSAVSNVSLTGNPSANVTTGTINTLRLAGASTVTITSANTLSLGAGGLLAAGSGGAMLITGGTLRGANGSTQPERDLVVLQHNTTSALTIASSIANTAAGATSLTKGGNGILELSGSNSLSGGITIGGGVLKISNTNAMGTSSVKLAGGVLGLAAGDISSATIGSGAVNRFSWQGSGGFAAYGGDRTITFSDASFDLSTASATNAQRNGELLLSAPDADGKITLAMGGGNSLWIIKTVSAPFMGTIRVSNGSAPIDADISAPIAVVADGRGGLQKMGAGVLQLSGSNTYNGPTIIGEGGLLVTGTNLNAMVTEVRDGTWLGGTGRITSLELQATGTIAPGLIGSIGTLATTANPGNGYFLWNGGAGSAAQMAFQLSTTDNTSDRLDLGTAEFLKGTGATFKFDFLGTNGKAGETYTLVSFGTTSFTDVSAFSYDNLGSNTGTFALEANALTFTVVPEPSTIALACGGVAAFVLCRRGRRRRGS